jgi:hypothetical protein
VFAAEAEGVGALLCISSSGGCCSWLVGCCGEWRGRPRLRSCAALGVIRAYNRTWRCRGSGASTIAPAILPPERRATVHCAVLDATHVRRATVHSGRYPCKEGHCTGPAVRSAVRSLHHARCSIWRRFRFSMKGGRPRSATTLRDRIYTGCRRLLADCAADQAAGYAAAPALAPGRGRYFLKSCDISSRSTLAAASGAHRSITAYDALHTAVSYCSSKAPT